MIILPPSFGLAYERVAQHNHLLHEMQKRPAVIIISDDEVYFRRIVPSVYTVLP